MEPSSNVPCVFATSNALASTMQNILFKNLCVGSIHVVENKPSNVINVCKEAKSPICFFLITYTGRSVFVSHVELLIPLSKRFNFIVICVKLCDSFTSLAADFCKHVPRRIRKKCFLLHWEKWNPDTEELKPLESIINSLHDKKQLKLLFSKRNSTLFN